MQYQNNFSILDLLDIIHDSSTPKPEAMLVSEVWDFKNWIPSEFLGKLKGHTKHQCLMLSPAYYAQNYASIIGASPIMLI